MDAELTALADKFETWETEDGGLNEYQNYRLGAAGSQKSSKGRPSSVTGPNSRLLRPTNTSKAKQENQNPNSDPLFPADDDLEE